MRARSWTSSTTRLPKLRELTVHDPATIPEWDELFGKPPTPAEQEIVTATGR